MEAIIFNSSENNDFLKYSEERKTHSQIDALLTVRTLEFILFMIRVKKTKKNTGSKNSYETRYKKWWRLFEKIEFHIKPL